jgi:hypothetical protein
MVTLAGKYSAGKVVKCEQCLTVYKAGQKNSCPKGMKIFSPRTRADWKTFLASAGPFACTPLDHRCHPPSERLWWVHQISNEIYAATAGNMENIRSLTVVASEQQVQ